MCIIRALLFSVCFLTLTMITSKSFAAQEHLIKYSWVQLGPENKKFFRIISAANSCPLINVDGKIKMMEMHSTKDRSFNVISCFYVVEDNDQVIDVAGKIFEVSKKKIEKIAVVGDTGCRITAHTVQDCKRDWHFPKIMTTILNHKPDLVIHLGDYYYREKCIMNEKCKYENTGDNFRTWEDDFFKPSLNVLDVAPWVFLRGNHEHCSRGGLGWMHFFDFGKKCVSTGEEYVLNLEDDDIKVLVLDSASKAAMPKSNDYMTKNLWILTHVPFKNEEMAHLPNNLKVVISGHEHKAKITETNGITSVIMGNGGALIEEKNDSQAFHDYGFTIINKVSDGWLFTVRNYDDTMLLEHRVKN